MARIAIYRPRDLRISLNVVFLSIFLPFNIFNRGDVFIYFHRVNAAVSDLDDPVSHASAICARLSEKGTLIGIDRDRDALNAAEERLSEYGCRKLFVQNNYSEIKAVLKECGVEKINGALLDLGVSSFQLDNADRGFSYMYVSAGISGLRMRKSPGHQENNQKTYCA